VERAIAQRYQGGLEEGFEIEEERPAGGIADEIGCNAAIKTSDWLGITGQVTQDRKSGCWGMRCASLDW
jgi:hypothetical protein